jgi:ABC-type amino acid transport substrate-binding protein
VVTRKPALLLFLLYSCSAYSEQSLSVSAPPSIWAETKGSKMQGPIIKVVTETFAGFGISVESQALPWDRAMHRLRSGKLDAMLVLNRTAERDQYIKYSVAYAEIPVSVFVPKGHSFMFSNLADLIGKTGIVVQGEKFGKKFETFRPKLTLLTVTTTQQLAGMLSKKRADYAISQNYAFLSEAKRLKLTDKYDVLPHTITSTAIYVGFSKKSQFIKYLHKFNTAIMKMKEKGKFQHIINNAISAPISMPDSPLN